MKYRIFLSNIPNDNLMLTKEQLHHLVNVLRVQSGESIEILDGCGNIYQAHLNIHSKKSASLDQITHKDFLPKPKRKMALYIGITKLNTIDTIVQKATELGASDIYPIICDFTPVKKSQLDNEKKFSHWERIIESSLIQSRNPWKPELHPPKALKDIEVNQLHVLDPYASHPLSTPTENDTFINIAIGPEGGWSDEERALFILKKWITYRFDTPILRAETAVCAALAIASLSPPM